MRMTSMMFLREMRHFWYMPAAWDVCSKLFALLVATLSFFLMPIIEKLIFAIMAFETSEACPLMLMVDLLYVAIKYFLKPDTADSG